MGSTGLSLTPATQDFKFSVALWRVLNTEELVAFKKSVQTREKFKDFIIDVARDSAKSSEPILRPLEYNFPHQGFEKSLDRFMIGNRLLVAPVTQAGQTQIEAKLPQGTCKGDDGKNYAGDITIEYAAALDVLPYFELQN